MNLNTLLWISESAVQAAVVGLLLYRRAWRTLPVFCLFSAWCLAISVVAYVTYRHFPSAYLTVYFADTALDSALQFGVLIELAWSVLRPLRGSLTRRVLVPIGASILALGGAIWPLATVPGTGGYTMEWRLLLHLQQDISILRVLLFLVLAGCSQLLSIGWRDRELQVATGLGIYSLVSLAAALMHTHQSMESHFYLLDRIVLASYLLSLLYWVFSFAQKEAKRREFTPQMRDLLLAMAGTAKATRIALADSAAAKMRNPKD